MNNGFNVRKVYGTTHVPCIKLKRYQKIINPFKCNVYKIKGYLNFHINNLKLFQNEIGSKLYYKVNNVMNVTTINNIDHSLLHQALCKLKKTKCDENVIISNNSCNM
jgi:hypothetical protein